MQGKDRGQKNEAVIIARPDLVAAAAAVAAALAGSNGKFGNGFFANNWGWSYDGVDA